MRRTTKYSGIRAQQESPGDRYPELAEKLNALASLGDRQYSALFRSLQVGGELYTTDILFSSVVSRSMELIESYLFAMDEWSISVATALVRLQVDNVLRCHLFAVTPDPDEILRHLLRDEPLEKLPLPDVLVNLIPEDDRQKKMYHRDWVLRLLAAQELEWVDDAYKVSSSWIHHSAAHLWATCKITDSGTFSSRVPADIDRFDESFLRNLIDVMGASSRAIVRYLDGWTESKQKRSGS